MTTTRRYSRSPLRMLLLAATALGLAIVVGLVVLAVMPRQVDEASVARAQAAELQAGRDRAELAALRPRIEAAQERVAGREAEHSTPDGHESQRHKGSRPQKDLGSGGPVKPGPRQRSRRSDGRGQRRSPKAGSQAPAPASAPRPVAPSEPPRVAPPAPAPPPAAPAPAQPSSPPNRSDRPKPATGEFGP